jgi:hypothetical protein
MYCIYDLDGTLICSQHRQITLADGSLDLDHWRENSTPEKVARDSLLPLVSLYRKHYRMGHTILFCTARVLGDPDYSFLMDNGLMAHYTLSRPGGCRMPDAELKEIQLRLFAHERGITWEAFCDDAILYDDNQKVLSHLMMNGLKVQDAVILNRVCAA